MIGMVFATPVQDLAAPYIAREIIQVSGSYDAAYAYGIIQAPPNAHVKLQSISMYGATSSSGDYVQFLLMPPSATSDATGAFKVADPGNGSYMCIEGMGFGGATVAPTSPLPTFPTRNAMNMIIPAGWTLAVSWATNATLTADCGFSAVGIYEYTPQTLNFNSR